MYGGKQLSIFIALIQKNSTFGHTLIKNQFNVLNNQCPQNTVTLNMKRLKKFKYIQCKILNRHVPDFFRPEH